MNTQKIPLIKKLFRDFRWKVAQLWIRLHPNVEVIGITGSVGKTTVKDMLATVLAEQFSVVKTKANFDPIFNIPLSVLRLRKKDEKFVAEMGTDGFGQISKYLTLVQPRIGVVTRFSLAHSDSEHFGSLEGLVKEKSTLIKSLPIYGWAILNGDDSKVRELAGETKATTLLCGFNEGNDLKITNYTKNNFTVQYGQESWKFTLPLLGKHSALLATLVIAVATVLGVTPETIQKGFNKVTPTAGRLEVKQGKNYLIIDDTYNASPEAVKIAIDVLTDLGPSNTALALGEMLELGSHAEQAHFSVGEYTAKSGIEYLAVLGNNASHTIAGFMKNGGCREHTLLATSHNQIAEWLKQQRNIKNILVKGSRGMKMENVVSELIN